MSKDIKNKIDVNGVEIDILTHDNQDYISLTDLAKYKNAESPADVIKNWLRRKDTIEFLGVWEQLNNNNFKLVEFDQFKNNAGTNAFTLSPQQWIKNTNAIGIQSKSGRYGGTYAHSDIALEFASWLSAEFKLYVIKEFQRLKQSESYSTQIEWNVKREISKATYSLHTDAIKEFLIPKELSRKQVGYIYADEADLLNVALFGMTAREFKEKFPDKAKHGNQRDYATIEQNIIMVNLQNSNALLIEQGLGQSERLQTLRHLAVKQLETLTGNKAVGRIKDVSDKQENNLLN
ncbi:KilA-N domain-containing protein [Lactococcus muris]|uniref:KilA-N domain-containing protein n=1 Tax=Lactococcus muris TaxID=2941330 RepID=UPI002301454F